MSLTQKQFFFPIKTPQSLNTADMIESDFVSNFGSTVTMLHVILLCSKWLGPPLGSVFLDCVNNPPYYCCGHCSLFDTQSSFLSPLPVQSASKVIFGQFYPCALSVTPAWFLASVHRVQCTIEYREKMLFISLWDRSLPEFFKLVLIWKKYLFEIWL